MRRAEQNAGDAQQPIAASCSGYVEAGVRTPAAEAGADALAGGRVGWVAMGSRGRCTGLLTIVERLARSVSAHHGGG